MDINDLNNLALNNNIYLNSEELNYAYNYIKSNYLKYIDNPNLFDISKHTGKISKENIIKINNLINKYKKE